MPRSLVHAQVRGIQTTLHMLATNYERAPAMDPQTTSTMAPIPSLASSALSASPCLPQQATCRTLDTRTGPPGPRYAPPGPAHILFLQPNAPPARRARAIQRFTSTTPGVVLKFGLNHALLGCVHLELSKPRRVSHCRTGWICCSMSF